MTLLKFSDIDDDNKRMLFMCLIPLFCLIIFLGYVFSVQNKESKEAQFKLNSVSETITIDSVPTDLMKEILDIVKMLENRVEALEKAK